VPAAGDAFAAAAADAGRIRDALGPHRVAVVLGSGWADAAERLGPTRAELPVTELPGFAAPTVEGHHGRLRSVEVDGAPVLVQLGRVHLYEGHDAATVVHGVRAAVLAGCEVVVLTNAAGSLRPEVGVGTPVLVADHLNLTGANPMVGPGPFPAGRPRFVDLTGCYDPALRAAARAADPSLVEGTYAGLLGGSFETPAEIRMLATLGADLVGMSTVLEAVAARHLGARVAAVSLVTNLAAGLTDGIDHEEVLDAGAAAAERLAGVLRLLVGLA
jgi:purine-nucleoside phosphorylase